MTRDEKVTKLMEEFKFCPCGQPEKTLKLIRDVLRFLDWRMTLQDEATRKDRQEGSEFTVGGNHFKDSFDIIRDKWKEDFPLDGFEDFVMHWLDAGGYTEHGGSVLTCWLEAEGCELLEELEALELDDE